MKRHDQIANKNNNLSKNKPWPHSYESLNTANPREAYHPTLFAERNDAAIHIIREHFSQPPGSQSDFNLRWFGTSGLGIIATIFL